MLNERDGLFEKKKSGTLNSMMYTLHRSYRGSTMSFIFYFFSYLYSKLNLRMIPSNYNGLGINENIDRFRDRIDSFAFFFNFLQPNIIT